MNYPDAENYVPNFQSSILDVDSIIQIMLRTH
jgi:hypothetical protein